MTPGFSYAEDGPTADLTVDTWGETLEEVFRQSAIALFNAILTPGGRPWKRSSGSPP